MNRRLARLMNKLAWPIYLPLDLLVASVQIDQLEVGGLGLIALKSACWG